MIKLTIELPELPPVLVQRHPRSRRLSLKLCARKGLRLTAPPKASLRLMQQFVEHNRVWINKHWSNIVQQVNVAPKIEHRDLLDLLALNEIWQVQRVLTESVGVRLKIQDSPAHIIELKGRTDEPIVVDRAVRAWLHAYAKLKLLPWLHQLSQDSGLPYTKATVRFADTRWGSCSSKKHIMLNVKLLFLPKALAQYVMLHELCHTVHMNHSPVFWQLLHSLAPDSSQLRQQLRHSQCALPRWLNTHASLPLGV